MPRSRADIATERASDYIGKFCRHVSRIAQSHSGGEMHVEWSEMYGTATFPRGRCTLEAQPEALIVCADATDEASLQRVEGLIAKRLETFGSGERLKVTWTSAEAPALSID